VAASVADQGSGAFLPPGSGNRIRDEFFRILDPEGMFFGEVFLRILVLLFFLLIKHVPENTRSKKRLVLFCIPLFMHSTGRIRDPVLFYPQDPG
jgi:hypothetical protein